ncbi:MAG: transposase family protein, partial [Colwellia sp.]|nr:transposase family protein [Colwellia sp.]
MSKYQTSCCKSNLERSTAPTISKAFGELTNPRINQRLRHPLVNILTISIYAIIRGCDDFCAIEKYG